jgi:predicted ArsR family transcriptional regulator
MTPSHNAILNYLKNHGPMSHDDLGRALDILPSVVLAELIKLSQANQVRPSMLGQWFYIGGRDNDES